MTIIVKKTNEISPAEWDEITAGFNEEFKKDKSPADLIRFYNANFKGYSYHGFARSENGILAGFTSINPTAYTNNNGEQFFAGLSGSTFVKKAFRNDIFIFQDIYKSLRAACAADGCQLVLGVPNKNSFKYVVKLLGFKFLYNLSYHVLPLRIHKIIQNKWLGLISTPLYWAIYLFVKLVALVSLLYNPKEKRPMFNIVFPGDAYDLRFNEAYTTVRQANLRFTYRIYEEKNVRTAYLFDFGENDKRSLRVLAKAISHIMAREKIDMIAFVGQLNLRQPLLLQLPKSKEPQQLPLTIDLLVSETDSQYAAFANGGNWNFGLMNFDVR